MAKDYRSPFTNNIWTSPAEVSGTIAALAQHIHDLTIPTTEPLWPIFPGTAKPVYQRKPAPDFPDANKAITLAVEAAGSIAKLPKITAAGETVGRQISDAYWQSKEARGLLQPIVGEFFVQCEEFLGENWQREKGSDKASLDSVHLNRRQTAVYLAWFAARLTEQIATGKVTKINPHNYAHGAALGALAVLEQAGVSPAVYQPVERVWRFVVAAGRMPVAGVDDDLLAAFEAALLADEVEVAVDLVK